MGQCVFSCFLPRRTGFFLFLFSNDALVPTAKRNPPNTGQRVPYMHSIAALSQHLYSESSVFCLVFVLKHQKKKKKPQKQAFVIFVHPGRHKNQQAYRRLTTLKSCRFFIRFPLYFKLNLQMRQPWSSWVFMNMHSSIFLKNKVYLSINICKSIIKYIRVFGGRKKKIMLYFRALC